MNLTGTGAPIGHRTVIQGIAVIHVRGDLSFREMIEVRRAVGAFLMGGHTRMVLSMAGVDHVNYLSIGILVEQQRLLMNCSGALKIAGMNSYVRDIFALVGMDQLFEIYATVEEALESCSEEWSDSDGVMQ